MASIFEKIFKGGKKQVQDSAMIHTTPLSEEQIRPVANIRQVIYPTQFVMGSGQSVGKQRDHNEDTLFSMSSVLADGNENKPFGLCIVADGMGGHKNGEIASSVGTMAVVKHIINRVYGHVLDTKNDPLEESLQEILEQAVGEAQKSVVRHAPGGGTTLTVALILGGQVTIAHVGDSRAYFVFPDSRMLKLTKDHSLVQRMVDLEELTEAEAFVHPQKNVLLKAIGQPDPFRADVQSHQIPHNGRLLLCSDGLWGVLPETEFFKILSKSQGPAATCQQLVDAANEAGGPDNISVVLVDFLGD